MNAFVRRRNETRHPFGEAILEMDTGDMMPNSTTCGEGSENQPPGPLHILLVEDNKDIARVLSSLLTRFGHQVSSAANIDEAVRLATRSGPFGLLISDLSLPDGSGLDLMRRLDPIRGIAISGYSTEVDLQECLDAGFVDLLSKPVSISALKDLIRRISCQPTESQET